VDRLVADTASGDALPLLAFTLAKLAAGVERGGCLSVERYEQLGGVQGALSAQADAALGAAVAAGGRDRSAVLRELLRLVTVDEQGHPTRRRIAREELPPVVAAELDCFVDRRLLTTDTEDERVTVTVAHEAFLSTWPPLAEAVAAASTALRARRAVEHAAAGWAGTGRPPDRLWERGQLAAAVADVGARLRSVRSAAGVAGRLRRRGAERSSPAGTLVVDRIELSVVAAEFLHASIRRDTRLRRRSVTVLSVLLVLALAAGAVAFQQGVTAVRQRDDAVHSRVTSQAEQLREVDSSLAAQLDVVAHRMRPTPELRTALVTEAGAPLAVSLRGHTDTVSSVRFIAGDRALASVSLDRSLRVWDVAGRTASGPANQLLPGGREVSGSLAVSGDGRMLVHGTNDGSLRVWDVGDPSRATPIGSAPTGRTDLVTDVAISTDGRTAVTANAFASVHLWDLTDPTRPTPLGGPLPEMGDEVAEIALSPDGRNLAVAGRRRVSLWDITDRARPVPRGAPPGQQDATHGAVAFSPGGVLAIAQGTTVRLWDVRDPARPTELGRPLVHPDLVHSVAFSARGMLATGGSDKAVRLWNVTHPEEAVLLGQPLLGHGDAVLTVAFSADGSALASGDNGGGTRVWDLPTVLQTGLTDYLNNVALADDGRTLAIGSGSVVELWDIADGRGPARLGAALSAGAGGVDGVAFGPDGRTLVGGGDRAVRLWDTTDPAHPAPLGAPVSVTGTVDRLALSPDGRTLATGGPDRPIADLTSTDALTANSTVRLWDISDRGAPKLAGTVRTKGLDSLAFSPNGRVLAVGRLNFLELFDVADPDDPRALGKPVNGSQDGFVQAVAFSPDSTILAANVQQTLRMWRVADPAHPQPLGPPLPGQPGGVLAVAFSPDGHTLASAGQDHTVRLWDVSDPARAVAIGTPLVGHTNQVHTVAFTPDGRTLLTGSRDQTVRFWTLDVERAIERICATTGDALTSDGWARYVSADLPFDPPCP
jgi:WD40 repeat protein